MFEPITEAFPDHLKPYALLLIAIVTGALGGYLVTRVGFAALRRLTHRSVFVESTVRNLRGPSLLIGALVGVIVACETILPLGSNLAAVTERISEVFLYGAVAWLVIEFVEVVGDLLLRRYAYTGGADNFRQRKIYTQLLYIKRVVTVVAVIIAIALTLFQFERVRELGTGILASAGVAGIAVGFAAQKSLANLLAGFQIAFTQPIRIDDQVLISGEFGRVEEITLTYVVVRIWDDRRLIVPLNQVIDEPFQNWSRHSTELLGTVMLYLDYGADLSGLREELARLTAAHAAFDGRVAKVQVTDTSELTMTVRVLVSASSPGEAFDLRCHVREGLLTYLREHQPGALPLQRESVQGIGNLLGEERLS